MRRVPYIVYMIVAASTVVGSYALYWKGKRFIV
jgi:hypothetical protein